uniref:DUF3102 domain-containing protein n=2 Tax=Rhodocyclus tenuis TaxID=1066 RepID=A0A840G929_RHOTE|nr:hypothetical protein [Rhodocyclus tenuis]
MPALREECNQRAVLEMQLDAHVRAVAAQIGYQLPGDYTDPDLIQRDISSSMRRSVEACIEVGRGLAVLKAACEHGQFISRLDVLGIDRKVAAKFMQSAVKFSNVSSTRHLTAALGNQTKLFEMLILDDEQLEELELTGQTGELKLDDIATMSVKELRAKLREARANANATERVIADKDAKINEMHRTLHKRVVSLTDWPEAFTGYLDQVAAARRSMEKAIADLDIIRRDAMLLDPQPGEEDGLEKAREALGIALVDALTRGDECLAKVRNIFEKTLGALVGE